MVVTAYSAHCMLAWHWSNYNRQADQSEVGIWLVRANLSRDLCMRPRQNIQNPSFWLEVAIITRRFWGF